MNKPLDELYFEWLYSKVASLEAMSPSQTYWNLLRILFQKEFVWLIPNDDNRVEEGKALRAEFLKSTKISDVEAGWLGLGCSMLELLVAFSRRIAEELDEDSKVWFWILIENLNLEKYNDHSMLVEEEVNDVLDQVIWRTYKRNGHGGLFPLKNHPTRDQTKIELWDQFGDFVSEQIF